MTMPGGRGRIRVLNVAEKPSVAKAVAEILSRRGGGFRSREGRSRYNRVFEFEYAIGPQLCHMLVTSVTGHLMELEFDDRFRKWHSCDPADLYHAAVRKHVPQDKLDIKRTLEEEARSCQWLVLWLDCDREGENIAFEVMEVCTSINHRLNVWRAHFSALIDREIHEAVQNLGRPNKLFADAVDVRQEIDLRIGASFTRFQTMLLRDAFVLDFAGDDRNVVLSYGPCQFPTLGFIVERYWEIQSHEPEEFWTINCSHTSDEGTTTFSWMRGHLFDYTSAVIVYEMCVEESTATVMNVRNQEKLKYPPYPLSTVELQKRASRYFRMSSEHTMKVAEELYQAGYISYPRTETDSFSVNTDLHAIVGEQVGHPAWGSYAQRLLDPEASLWRNPSNGGHNDKAHPPIHPTKFSAGEPGWSQDHNRLYELVVRHFLACVSKPAVGAETTVEIDIAGEQFSASGRVIIAKNYLDVYRFESWGGTILPTYTIGQQFIPTTLTLDSGVTRPPQLLSEADLLSCMDKAGIGTDATMHDHIKKLLDRCYATKDSNTRFSPTNLGEALVMGYDEMGYELWKPFLRSMMECDMKAVSIGSKRKSEVLEGCLQQMKACFLDARLNRVKLFEAMELFFERSNRSGADTHNIGETVRPCDSCHESDMVLKRRPSGDFMVGCLRFPLCRNVVWLPGSISEAAVTSEVCPTCAPGPVFLIQFKFRRLEIPPNYDVDHLGCIGGCDVALRELAEICGTGSRNNTGMTARAQRSTEPPSSTRRGNSRQDSCMYCRRTGHSSNDCPSQVSHSHGAPSIRIQKSRNGSGQVLCSCGAPCALRTANTETNRGRKFYTCQSQECGFFVWEDSLENGGTHGCGASHGSSSRASSTARRGGRGRGQGGARTGGVTFVSATGEPVSGSCFVCGDPSHFANVCPNRGS
ncbi:DNA topoisomerase 3-alpha isoform X1 [Phoenix dactylifera]|uniref:DNA topoisomerase n=1 Tax=Phoenix dactylifera TaxID=42345 RepID=A0A8B7CWV8_PHODC|nr:DNA topoisomerase 3-alpha isoform X1 [Phoenix dactylifera]